MSSGIDNPYYNIFIIFLCGVICWVASINSIRFGSGLGTFGFIYLPLIATGVIMLLYLLSRLVTRKKNWIVTLLGGLLLIVAGVWAYYDHL